MRGGMCFLCLLLYVVSLYHLVIVILLNSFLFFFVFIFAGQWTPLQQLVMGRCPTVSSFVSRRARARTQLPTRARVQPGDILRGRWA